VRGESNIPGGGASALVRARRSHMPMARARVAEAMMMVVMAPMR
jgi:hypothetical protein